MFKLTGKPLYGGKGKHSDLRSKNRDNVLDVACIDAADILQPDEQGNNQGSIGIAFKGLQQPQLQGTQGVVRGKDKTIMRKENKQQCQELRTAQPLISPWT